MVLPQLDIRHEVVARLDAIAAEHRARFLEVILTAPTADLAARIAHAPPEEVTHPRDLFTPEEIEAQIEHYTGALDRLANEWPGASSIDVSGLSPSEAAARVEAAIRL
ncbi:MAG: hypothetical protein QOG03_168 [Actinomycetota bacterium]|nr:hypothetical protein [Actinomycetota bacterium]